MCAAVNRAKVKLLPASCLKMNGTKYSLLGGRLAYDACLVVALLYCDFLLIANSVAKGSSGWTDGRMKK